MEFSVEVHHGGTFVTVNNVNSYLGGELHAIHGIDPDRWSYFEAVSLLKELGYMECGKLWWKPKSGSLEKLKLLSWDTHATELANYAIQHGEEIDIYVEHDIVHVPVVLEHIDFNDDNVEEIQDDDSVHYNEFGEEMEVDLDDGFEPLTGCEESQNETPKGKGQGKGKCKGKGSKGRKGSQGKTVNERRRKSKRISEKNKSDGDEHVIDDEYFSDELYSDVEGSDSDIGELPRYKVYKKESMCKNFKWEVGMEFGSIGQFKEAILEYSVMNGRSIKFLKNDLKRARAVCKTGCGFEIYVSQVGTTSTYRVKTLYHKHTCARVFDNKNANSRWVAKMVEDNIRSNSKYKLNDIIDEMRRNFAVEITSWRAFRAKQIAKNVVEGDAIKQYSLLWRYSAELRRVNAGNTCKLLLNRPDPVLQPRFGSFYMCLEGCKRGFIGGCRPFIGVDGCHLKGKCGGIMLIAVGRDPNDQYFPIAVAVVEAENKNSWRWFLNNLFDDIGDIRSNRWVFMSDQQKGLEAVFDEVLEGVEHRHCLRHLYNNFKKAFGGGTELRDLLMSAAKATHEEDWKARMQQLRQKTEAGYNWLIRHTQSTWCKHAFSYYPRCDVLMNNLSEAFNSTILIARDKPIITMLEWIRTYLMTRFSTLRAKLAKYSGIIMPKPMKRLDREVEGSGNWIPRYAGENLFEVTHTHPEGGRYTVNLGLKNCSCNFWDLTGIPCRHAVAAISYKCDQLEPYVHSCYKREAYALCNGPTISPINGQNMWPHSDQPEILPPIFKRGPGRPKKLRRREPDEPRDQSRWKRSNTHNRCSRCSQVGHNYTTCQQPAPANEDADPTESQGQAQQADAVLGSEPQAQQAAAVPGSEPQAQQAAAVPGSEPQAQQAAAVPGSETQAQPKTAKRIRKRSTPSIPTEYVGDYDGFYDLPEATNEIDANESIASIVEKVKRKNIPRASKTNEMTDSSGLVENQIED